MNLPNKISMARMLLVPVFAALALTETMGAQIAALVVFCAASLTDAIDGHIARSRNLITNFTEA